jgi:hypothetical protein
VDFSQYSYVKDDVEQVMRKEKTVIRVDKGRKRDYKEAQKVNDAF